MIHVIIFFHFGNTVGRKRASPSVRNHPKRNGRSTAPPRLKHSLASHSSSLDKTHAAFLGGPVAIGVASCDSKNSPSLARGYGCRVSSDRRKVTVFLSLIQAGPLLRDLKARGAIAVVFCRPSSHETLQLKGSDAKIIPLGRGDRAAMTAYIQAFLAEIRTLGYQDCFLTGLRDAVEGEAVGVSFTPTSAFVQTPGPEAGRCLGTTS